MNSNESSSIVLLDGARYLDAIVEDMERQAEEMRTHASESEIDQVREGYIKFADTLTHCVDVLRKKSAELRSHHSGQQQ